MKLDILKQKTISELGFEPVSPALYVDIVALDNKENHGPARNSIMVTDDQS